MKRLFTIVAAAFMSVAMFASREVVPSDADLESYATEMYTMCIYNGEVCNGIVLNGTYAGWPNAADHATLLDFQPVDGFEGWYVVSWNDETGAEAKDGGVQAKPIQLDGSGNFNWDYQLGPDAELVRGVADLFPGNNGTEVDIKNIGAGIVVIDVKSWKNNPCTAVYHDYNVTLVSPDCNDEDYITPAISGGFNGWAQEAMTMNELKTAERQNAGLPGAVFEISFRAAEGSDFKFRSAEEWGEEWTNELKEYVAEDDEWKAFNGGANIVLGEETDLEFDLGDPEKYSWNNCEKPVEEEAEYVVAWINLPVENRPEAVEIIGGFDAWEGTAMELLDNGWFFVELEAKPSQFFKFRGAGSWDQELELYNAEDETWSTIADGQLVFGQLWEDSSYKGTDCKSFELDFSNPEMYRWTVASEGIENVVLTEKANKVVVDGVLYIIRDNKMFNVQGTQVR